MSRQQGGYIGFNRVPAASAANSAASGVWTVREAESLKRAGTWPTAPTVPGTPTSLAALGGNAQASLTWTAPASNGGSAITDYAVQFSSDSGSTWTTFADGTSTATSAVVTGLTNGTAYVFRVATVNSAGTGSYSGTATATPTAIVFSSIQANWTGTGSSSDKLTPPQTGNTSGGPGAFTEASFTAGKAGTLKVAPVSHDGGDRHERRVKKNGVTVQAWEFADPVQVSFSVTSGDVIVLDGGYGLLWNKGTRVWIE